MPPLEILSYATDKIEEIRYMIVSLGEDIVKLQVVLQFLHSITVGDKRESSEDGDNELPQGD